MPYDKKLHAAAGLLISLAAGYAFFPLAGLAFAAVTGLLKEIRDWIVYRGFDEIDCLATWAGGLLGYIVVEAIKWIF